jgi:hypothetical protein
MFDPFRPDVRKPDPVAGAILDGFSRLRQHADAMARRNGHTTSMKSGSITLASMNLPR